MLKKSETSDMDLRNLVPNLDWILEIRRDMDGLNYQRVRLLRLDLAKQLVTKIPGWNRALFHKEQMECLR